MDVLVNPDVQLADVLLRTNVERLSILPAGKHHRRATEVLSSEAMARLIDEMASRYPDRIVLWDAPPLLPTTESRVLAGYMGQIVVVVEADRTHAPFAQECPRARRGLPGGHDDAEQGAANRRRLLLRLLRQQPGCLMTRRRVPAPGSAAARGG